MVTEIITFKVRAGMGQEEVFAQYEKTAPTWRSNPDLIRKNYLFDSARGIGGGVYLWRNREDAEKWHGAEFRKRILEMWGSTPQSEIFETPIVVDNQSGELRRE